jgi:hypothetical protein
LSLRTFNWKQLILVAVLAGLAQVAAGIAMYLAGVYFASWSMLVTLLLLLICIICGTRWYAAHPSRPKLNYGETLIIGVVISVSTGIIYAIYNIISISFFYPNFLDDYVRINAANGLFPPTPEMVSSMRAMVSAPVIAVGNLIRLSIAGTLLSLVASLFLRKKS